MGITNSCFHHLNLEEVEKKVSGKCSGGGVEEVEKKESGECSGGGVEEVEKKESGECSGGGVEEEIEFSKTHWSILDVVEGEEVAEVSNVEEFLTLQRHPLWGGFFQTFNGERGNENDIGELVVGEKFAEGGQAELYDCMVKVGEPKGNRRKLKDGDRLVLKVFKKGTYLKHLKSLLPQGLLQFHVESMENFESIMIPRSFCRIHCGTLLKDGRFAFLMDREQFDLRHLIDRNMKRRRGTSCGPFSKEEVEVIMFRVALGVEWLHKQGIVHRDLKASNVLGRNNKIGWAKLECLVADYECSVGVVGTGFFRAPEILQACKESKLRERPEVFSKAVDIYGYGMICYEVLTGKLPFEGHPLNDYNHVLCGHRPLVPIYVEDWIHELLDRCWQLDPTSRPCIGEILSVILTHSRAARIVEKVLKKNVPNIATMDIMDIMLLCEDHDIARNIR